MTIPSQLQNLVSQVVQTYPTAQFEFDPLPSGVCFFSASLNGRNFEIEYSPNRGTGVSENFPHTPPFIGHDRAFASLDEAVGCFKTLLDDAAKTENASSIAFVMHDKPISK